MENTKIIELDLHGVKHEDASTLIEEWYLKKSYNIKGFTGKIITGNSDKMKNIVINTLKQYKPEVYSEFNGYILINDKLF